MWNYSSYIFFCFLKLPRKNFYLFKDILFQDTLFKILKGHGGPYTIYHVNNNNTYYIIKYVLYGKKQNKKGVDFVRYYYFQPV